MLDFETRESIFVSDSNLTVPEIVFHFADQYLSSLVENYERAMAAVVLPVPHVDFSSENANPLPGKGPLPVEFSLAHVAIPVVSPRSKLPFRVTEIARWLAKLYFLQPHHGFEGIWVGHDLRLIF